jgi:hypothetical protein
LKAAGWIAAGLLITGCGGGTSSPPADGAAPLDDSVGLTDDSNDLPPRPVELDQLAPSDTGGVLALMRGAINYSNAVADRGERSDTTLTVADAALPVTVTLWSTGTTPLRMIIARQVAGTAIPEETIVWFDGGTVQVVQEPQDILLFDADRIVFWTDEGMVPLPYTEEERMAHERQVIDMITEQLELFGIVYRE